MFGVSIPASSPELFSFQVSEKAGVRLGSRARFARMADMTFKEACEELALSRSQLYALVRRNEIPHYRLGKLIRFERIKLASFKDAGGTAAQSSPDPQAPESRFGDAPEVGSSSAWRRRR